MPTVTLRELTTPIARELSEYTLLKNDLIQSFEALELWFNKYAGRKKDDMTNEERLIALSLFRNAIIMFVGCFDKSAKVSLSETDIYSSRKGGLEYFKWLQDIRDTYAAHTFGPLRQCSVGVLMDEAGTLVGTGHHVQIYAGPIATAKGDILSFISAAGRHVEKIITDLALQMLKDAKKMTPSELAVLKVAEVHDVDPRKIRTSRDSFLRSLRKGDQS